MTEFFKKNTVLVSFVLCAIFMTMFIVISRLDRERVSEIQGINHIASVMAADRNCNDCHLSMSFVNLFKHRAVRDNDNTIRLMLDKANIKRW